MQFNNNWYYKLASLLLFQLVVSGTKHQVSRTSKIKDAYIKPWPFHRDPSSCNLSDMRHNVLSPLHACIFPSTLGGPHHEDEEAK